MKKLLLSAIAVSAFSFFTTAQMKIGFKAGAGLAEQRVNVSKGNSMFSNNKERNYQAGLVADLKMTRNLYLQPQLLYTRTTSTLLSSTGAADTRLKINYAELPLNLVYKVPLPFGQLFGGTGLSYKYAFSGQQEQNGKKTGMFGGNTWRRHDLGLNFTAGVEFKNGLFASVNSQKGLTNISKIDGVSVKNRSTSFSVGYLVNLRKT